MLIEKNSGLKIRLDKAVSPPGTYYTAGVPVQEGMSVIGIEGISQSQDGRMLRVDYILRNAGPGVMMLEQRDYGRFGVLIDKNGWSYSACDYKMLGPAIPPGGSVEGYLDYVVNDANELNYLLFWPPDEDAVLFQLGIR
jgi:hypothetical protein